MEKNYDFESFILAYLLVGSFVLVGFGIAVILLFIHSNNVKKRLQSEHLAEIHLLVNQVSKLQNENLYSSFEREEFLSKYLLNLVSLFQKADRFIEQEDSWIKECEEINNSINEEYARLRRDTYFLKNLDLPLKQLIKTYIDIINKHSFARVTITVHTYSVIAHQTKKQLFHIIQAITLFPDDTRTYHLQIEEFENVLKIQYKGNHKLPSFIIDRLKGMEKNLEATLTLSMVDEGIIEILLPISYEVRA